MSVDSGEKDTRQFSDVNPIVNESLDTALGQLNLEGLDPDLKTNTGTSPNQKQSIQQSDSQVPNENEGNAVSGNNMPGENGGPDSNMVPPSHMFPPHPQMIGMGFIPFSQMMPIPHHTGFFPPSGFKDASQAPSPHPHPMGVSNPSVPAPAATGLTTVAAASPVAAPMAATAPTATPVPPGTGPILFNNTNDASVFAAPATLTPGFSTGAQVNTPTPLDPLWSGPPMGTGSAAADPVASSTVEESAVLDDGLPQKDVGAANLSFRRQTFHALSPNDLVGATETGLSTTESVMGNSTQKTSSVATPAVVRRQSVHMDKMFASEADDKVAITEDNSNDREVDQNSKTFAAAYPYGGPLLQPNPILSGHHPPGSAHAFGIPSPFPAGYGFTSPFQSFSPVLGPGNTPMQAHSSIPMAHSPLHGGPMSADPTVNPLMVADTTDPDGKHAEQFGVHGDASAAAMQPPQTLPMGLHQQGNTPPPWMYGGHPFGMLPHPHAVPQKPPHVMGLNPGIPNNNNNSHHQNRRHANNRGSKSGHLGNGKNRHNKNYYYGNSIYHENHQRKLEENSRYANATLDQFIGNIYSLCKDQHGCRFLQMQLDVLGPEAADAIYEETDRKSVV